MQNIKRVVAAMVELKRHQDRVAKIAAHEYPDGARISWERGRGIQHGRIEHSSFHQVPRFRVKNDHTGKSYWIDFYSVVCAEGEQIRAEYLDHAA